MKTLQTIIAAFWLTSIYAGSAAAACEQDKVADDLRWRFEMEQDEFVSAAKIEFNRCHRFISPTEAVPSIFRPNVNFPKVAPTPTIVDQPWREYHPINQPEAYLDALLGYVMGECGSDHADWDGNKCGWYHAPWMHTLREPIRGLTRERSSRLGELHPSQTVKTQNWAVGLYNDVGGYAFHKIWGDEKAFPNTRNFVFPDGTVAVKLLFSTAKPEQVPYLRYAKTWEIHDGERIVTARLIQLDVLVKDSRLVDGQYEGPKDKGVIGGQYVAFNGKGMTAEQYKTINSDLTGWAMGSYLYNGAKETTPRCDHLHDDPGLAEICERSRWRQRLIPIGLQWGNDPGMYKEHPTHDKPVQHWLNNDVTAMFAAGRIMSGHPPFLGLDGRMNGPVDNYRSTCMACHARAVDFGRYEEDRLRFVPFVAPDGASLNELHHFFRNLNSDVPTDLSDVTDEPFVVGTQSLDYSLQAADGLHMFRKWIETLPLPIELKDKTRNFSPKYGPYYEVPSPLKLVSWNIANLHHETGVGLRPGAPRRTDTDFNNLNVVGEALDAHVFALQEIGSPAALARVLPTDKYHFILSNRYAPGNQYRSTQVRDIYTAFAFKKEAFPEPPKVTTLDALSLPHLAYRGPDDVAESRPTRAGLVVEFHYNEHEIALLNVHIKSSCQSDNLQDITENFAGPKGEQGHRPYACRTQIAQLEIIENWVEMQIGLGKTIIIMGDFNRRLNDLNVSPAPIEDEFWRDLNDGQPRNLVKGPLGLNKTCWDGHSAFKPNHVDFIVADSKLLGEKDAVEIQKVDYSMYLDDEAMAGYPTKKDADRLSDHCPVVLNLKAANSQ